MRALTGITLAFASFSILLASCNDSRPSYTLQTVMLEVDATRKDLERALLTPGRLAEARTGAEEIERWMRDGALERYLERPDLLASPERFVELQREFDAELAGLLELLRQGQEAEARAAYPRLQAACDRCHATFRPFLLQK